MIPREGGIYKGDFYVAGSGSSFQSSNITPELKPGAADATSSISWRRRPPLASPVWAIPGH